MLIYSEHISPRLQYIAGFILGELLGLKPVFTRETVDVERATGPVIAYSRVSVGKAFHIIPAGLLHEKGIKQELPGVKRSGNSIFLYPVDGGNLSFDIFSASFWLLSRYEEYWPFEADMHGRFPATESLSFREGFLDVPVVNQWAALLAGKLRQMYPSLAVRPPVATFLPTIDIDIAWAIKNKSAYRTLGGLARQALLGNTGNIGERLAVLRGKVPDPFDTYRYIFDNHDEDLTVFMLAGPGGKYDLNNPVTNPAWQNLVKDLSEEFKIGFHPSYYTSERIGLYRKEKKIIENITGRPLTRIRQHFLRLTFPLTYRRSAAEGFSEDYSMGYAGYPGFRAGTSSPFLFYDLEKESITDLRIFSFTVMDRTLKDYLGLTPEEAGAKIRMLAETVKREGGCFIPIWHNDALGDKGEWKGWKAVYDDILKLKKDLF